LFATHPSVDSRVQALVKFAGGHDPGPLALPSDTTAPGDEQDQSAPAGQNAPSGPWGDAAPVPDNAPSGPWSTPPEPPQRR
jgi:heat shock protein HtpX